MATISTFSCIGEKEETVKKAEFEAETDPYMYGIFSFLAKLTKNAQDAEDLTQETFMRAFKYWHKYKKGTDLKNWLFQVAHNVYLNWCNKCKVRPMIVSDDTAFKFIAGSLDENPLSRFLVKENVQKVLSLPDTYRATLVFFILGYEYEDISEALRLPCGTVKSHIHRGRNILKKNFPA